MKSGKFLSGVEKFVNAADSTQDEDGLLGEEDILDIDRLVPIIIY
jgi:hypothetical protein